MTAVYMKENPVSRIQKRYMQSNIKYVTPAQAGVQNLLVLLDSKPSQE